MAVTDSVSPNLRRLTDRRVPWYWKSSLLPFAPEYPPGTPSYKIQGVLFIYMGELMCIFSILPVSTPYTRRARSICFLTVLVNARTCEWAPPLPPRLAPVAGNRHSCAVGHGRKSESHKHRPLALARSYDPYRSIPHSFAFLA